MTHPPQSPRVRAPALRLLLVLALAAAALMAWRVLGTTTDPLPPEVDGPEVVAATPLAGSGVERVDEVDPYGPPGPLSGDEVRTGLASRLSVRRLAVLKAIVARGSSDSEVVSLLRTASDDPDPLVALYAKAAVVRATGDRRGLIELARVAARAPAFTDPADLLRALDREGADAMMAAARALEGKDAPLGLAAALEALALNPEQGRAAVLDGMRRGEGDTFAAWAHVAGALRPTPVGAVEHLMVRFERGSPSEREAVATWLSKAPMDTTSLPAGFAAFLASRLAAPDVREAARFEAVVARLPALPAVVADALLERARASDPVHAQRVLSTLASTGPAAASVGGHMVDVVRGLPPEAQAMAVLALASVGGPDIAAYAARRLPGATPAEQGQWIDAFRVSPDAAGPLIDPLARIARGGDDDLAARAAAALVRWSASAAAAPGGAPAALDAAVTEVLIDPRVMVRARVVGALRNAPTWSAPVVVALARTVDDPDPGVAEAAAEAVAGAWRLGAAGAPLAPALVRLSFATTPTSRRSQALRSLAAVAPSVPEARARFVQIARDPDVDPASRMAAVYGLSRLTAPSAEERAALLAHADRPETKALIAATRRKPGWRDPASTTDEATSPAR